MAWRARYAQTLVCTSAVLTWQLATLRRRVSWHDARRSTSSFGRSISSALRVRCLRYPWFIPCRNEVWSLAEQYDITGSRDRESSWHELEIPTPLSLSSGLCSHNFCMFLVYYTTRARYASYVPLLAQCIIDHIHLHKISCSVLLSLASINSAHLTQPSAAPAREPPQRNPKSFTSPALPLGAKRQAPPLSPCHPSACHMSCALSCSLLLATSA